MKKHIPNILTLGRVVLTLGFLAMILYAPKVQADDLWWYLDIAFIVFVVSGVTDLLDGYFARRFEVVSKFGRIVDPLADKILVCGAFLCFAIIARPVLFADALGNWQHVLRWGVFGIITLRETFVTWLRQRSEAKGIDFPATFSGKMKMFVQSFAIGTVIIKMAHVPDALWGQWFTLIALLAAAWVTFISGFFSIKKSLRLTK